MTALAAAAALLVALVPLGWLYGGTLVRFATNRGQVVIEVDDPQIEVVIKDQAGTVTDRGSQREYTVRAGQENVVEVTVKDEAGDVLKFASSEFSVTRGGRQVLRIELAPLAAVEPGVQPGASAAPSPPGRGQGEGAGEDVADSGDLRSAEPAGSGDPRRTVDAAWLVATAGLAPLQQAAAVRAKLKELNPDFQGTTEFDLDDAAHIAVLRILDGQLLDLTPLWALKDLKQLDYPALRPQEDAAALREIAALETINGRPGETYRLAYPATKPPQGQGVTDQWLAFVRELGPAVQVAVVMDKLKELDPNFDGQHTFEVYDGQVTVLALDSLAVTDLTPLRALVGLRSLTCSASRPGWLSDLAPLAETPLTALACNRTRVSDLSPLAAMKLTDLHCADTPVSDLSPLAGMPLTLLQCQRTEVSDLSPLKGMPLTTLDCSGTQVSDLSPLAGMPMTALNCSSTQVSNLSPLAGMKLTDLYCGSTQVSDLSPLVGMPLTFLHCANAQVSDLSPLVGTPLTCLHCGSTQVSDLSPLKGMPLTALYCNATQVVDLSPLAGMPLTVLLCNGTQVSDLSPLARIPLKLLDCDFNYERDADLLRSITTLETINGKPAAEFWGQFQPPSEPRP